MSASTKPPTRKRPRSQRSLRHYTLPLAALLGMGLAALMPTNARLENAVNRAMPAPLNPDILVVGIDDASLRDYGRLELWPRSLYASALNTLNDAGARAVGLDVLLSDPDPGDDALNEALSRPNVVMATAPDDNPETHPNWTSPRGVSALNAPTVQGVTEVQTAYPVSSTLAGTDQSGTQQSGTQLMPSFARQVAAAAGRPLPLSITPRLMPYIAPEHLEAKVVSFRDIVNGTVRFSELQNKVVLVGLNASGLSGLNLPDIDGRPVPGVLMQARAVSSLLGPSLMGQALWRLPLWLTMLLCALIAGVTVWARELWGFGLAAGVLLLTMLLWPLHIVLPGVTLSLAAVLATGLVAFERWWQLRALRTADPLTGLGNRLAFTRAVEHRWPSRQEVPLSLLLIDLNHFRRVNEQYGRQAGDEVLRDLAARLQKLKRRGDLVFRWGHDEFAVLLDQVPAATLPHVAQSYRDRLSDLNYRNTPLSVNVGAAATASDILTPTDLIETASRDRYRMKYLREQQGLGVDG